MRELVNKRRKIAVKRKNREDGFTFIEVLVTIAILAMVLMAILSSFIYGFNVLSRMKQKTVATQCIQEELELIRNMAYDDIANLGSTFTNDNLSLLENSSGILNVEDSAGDDIKKLTVSVVWTYRGNQMREDIVTFVTRKGINKR